MTFADTTGNRFLLLDLIFVLLVALVAGRIIRLILECGIRWRSNLLRQSSLREIIGLLRGDFACTALLANLGVVFGKLGGNGFQQFIFMGRVCIFIFCRFSARILLLRFNLLLSRTATTIF